MSDRRTKLRTAGTPQRRMVTVSPAHRHPRYCCTRTTTVTQTRQRLSTFATGCPATQDRAIVDRNRLPKPVSKDEMRTKPILASLILTSLFLNASAFSQETEWETVQGLRFAHRWTVFRSGVRVAEATVERTRVTSGLQQIDLAAKPLDLRPVFSSR